MTNVIEEGIDERVQNVARRRRGWRRWRRRWRRRVDVLVSGTVGSGAFRVRLVGHQGAIPAEILADARRVLVAIAVPVIAVAVPLAVPFQLPLPLAVPIPLPLAIPLLVRSVTRALDFGAPRRTRLLYWFKKIIMENLYLKNTCKLESDVQSTKRGKKHKKEHENDANLLDTY